MPHSFTPAPGSDIYDLAWFPSPTWLEDLAAIALPESWDDEEDGRQPILLNYIRYTTRRLLEQGYWIEAQDPGGTRVSAFNTGLLSTHFEPIYAVFEENRNTDKQPWVHREWAVPSSPRLRPFDVDELRQAVYFDNPGEAVFDPRVPVVAKTEHIVDDNVDRYPDMLRDNAYLRAGMLERAITVAAAKAKANWRLAAPQFYWPTSGASGRLQLLLPLSLIEPDRVDLALVVDRHPSLTEHPSTDGVCYRAYTVLPVEWAYRNARLITRPEAYWLDPNSRADAGAPDADDDGQGAWRPARANNQCPVCGATGGCLLKADNRSVMCRNQTGARGVQTRSGATVYEFQSTWAAAE